MGINDIGFESGRFRRHHNLLTTQGKPNITGPINKGKGKGNTAGKGHGKGNGAGGGPPAATSNFPLIARTTTIEGGTIPLMGLDLTDYQAIFVAIDGVQANNTLTQLGLQISVGGVVRTSGYRYIKQAYDSANVNGVISSQSADRIVLTTNAATSGGDYSVNWTIQLGCDSSLWKCLSIDEHRITNDPRVHRGIIGATLEITGVVDGLLLLPDSAGIIVNGSMAVYGVKKGSRTAGAAGLASLWAGALT